MPRRLLVLAFATLLGGGAFGQDAPADAPATAADTRIAELQTAGYYELVARAQALGLAVTGAVADLRTRIAQAEGIVLPPETPAKEKTLTIDSAQEAGLVTVDAPGDGKLLRLSGGLQVTLVDKEKKVTHVIQAGELWYDQANEEMTARGQVVYTMIRETSTEVFRGESLTFRLSDSQGIFYGGASDRSRTVGDQTLTFRYRGDAIRRSAADLVVLDAGTITSSLGTDPYYQIKAKKIWVLAPGEWGLQDAWLYLGRIPVFYFPFFFQPGDEFFFNPVLSFPDAGDRRGTSLQTTTYFLGKKKKDTAPLSFLQVEDSSTLNSDRVQKGLFLVRGTPPHSDLPASWTFKYLADFYSHLGFLTSVDASLPGLVGLKDLTFKGGVGVTRTVAADGTTFSANPFQAELDPWDQSHWNGSWLGSWRLPVRWGGQFSLDSGPGQLALEYYSDPLLYNDLFGSRSENFSVFSLLGLGPAKTTTVATAKTSLQWSGALTLPPLALTGGLLWVSKATSPVPTGLANDPEANFYLPSQLTLPQVSLSLSGTLWPPGAATPTKDAKNPAEGLIPPDTDQTPPTDPTQQTQPPTNPEAATAEPGAWAPDRFDNLPNGTASPQWTSGATWSLKPVVKTDTRFDEASALGPSSSTWKALTSRWSGAYDGALNLTSGMSDGFLTATDGFTLHQQAQGTWYKSPTLPTADSTTYDLQDKQQTSSLLTQNLGSALKPFVAGGGWRESNLQYSLVTKLWESTADKTRYFDGTTATVTTHQTSAQAIYYLLDGIPSLKATAGAQSTLPPLDPLRTWSGAMDFALPVAKAYTKTSAKQTNTTFVWDPWETYGEWTPTPDLSLKETYQYDLQNDRPLSSTTSAGAYGFTAQYRHQRTTPYVFNTASKSWDVAGPVAFLPQELRFGYTLDLPALQWWSYRNTLSSKVNFTWPIDLQQYSQMPLTLNYTVAYKLYRFLDLQISEGIVNRTAYRYFPALVDSFGPGAVTVVNPVTDLIDAFSVWNQTALRRTSFKMTNLTIGLVHYLDDWQIKLDYTGSPQLVGASGVQQFQWVGTLALLVQWYPVPELKTQMNWDKDGVLTVAKNNTATTSTTSN